ncbi:amidohydrolase [Aquimarina sp. AD10]|uniref:amidohydrolase family protein n=1 Tax=Aquimarina TaxID=290174 RepID=UPI000E4F915B|nr:MULTISPECIES: amidohydrolase family protein [Aquimarina]AXT60544.1 amidohydrolase [Aquimarina sp. AD10]RKN01635.1 amidohydrolase [Aquimarina sp. AD10]
MKIDSHQHFWQYHPVKHSWINDDMKVLQQDYLPSDLKKVYQENAIDGCVAVQADQSEIETDFLIDLANENEFIKGIVGWIDLRAENLEERLQHYSKFDIIKGFRHVVQDEPDPNFIIGDSFKKGIALLHQYNFTYDILIFPHQLRASLKLIEEFPEHKFVIDHIAKPSIKNGDIKEWETLIREIAKHRNVYCKVSGMVTEADWAHWKYDDFVPYLDVVFDAFSTKRIMYGSDWPVCLLGGDYSSIKSIIEEYIKNLSAEQQEEIMGGNAIKFYQLS